MSLTTGKVDPDDKKMQMDWFDLKKTVLGTVPEDLFLYIDSQI